MSRDPSLLPEEMRKQEEQIQSKRRGNGNGRGALHVPDVGVDVRRRRVSAPAPTVVPSFAPPAPPPLPPLPPPEPPRVVEAASVTPVVSAPVQQSGGTMLPKVQLPTLHLPKLHKQILKSVSLIPKELRKGPVSQWWPLTIAVVGMVFVALLVGVPWLLLSRRVAHAQSYTEGIEATYSDLLGAIAEEERAVEQYRSTANRATVLAELLRSHGTWEGLFALIETRTLPGVQYERVSADTSGTIMLPTIAPNLRTAAMQLVAWEQAKFVTTTSTSGFSSVLDQLGALRGTRFDLQLQVDPALLTQDSDTIVSATLPASSDAHPASAAASAAADGHD